MSMRAGFISPSLHELERIVYHSHQTMRELIARTAHILSAPSKHQMFLERGTPGFGHFLGQGQKERDPDAAWEMGQGAVQMTFAMKNLREK